MHSTSSEGHFESEKSVEGPDPVLRSWLLFQVSSKLMHQLRNHQMVTQNAQFTLKKALELQDEEKIAQALKLATLGFQRAEGVLKTVTLFNSEDFKAVRILDHYRSRYSNAEIQLEYPHFDPRVEELLPAVVYSLEHLRTHLVHGATLKIGIIENRVQIDQSENEEIVPPPDLGDVLNHYYEFLPTKSGWEITDRGESKS